MNTKLTSLFFLVIIFAAISSFAQDAYLQNLALSPYLKINTAYNLSVNLFNNDGTTRITTTSVSWELDNNGTVNMDGPFTIGGGLPTGAYVQLPLPAPLNVSTGGQHTIKVWADADGEINRSNDTITFNFTVLTDYAPKVTLIEEATGEWCEHCPPAGVVTDSLANNPNVAVARFHNNQGVPSADPLAFVDEEDYFQPYFTDIGSSGFFPAATVDMSEGGNYQVNTDYPTWAPSVEAEGGISPLSLALTSKIDSQAQNVTITLTANFKYVENGAYRFNAFILENDIIQPQTEPDLTRTPKYVHNNVVRALVGGTNGTGGVIPTTPTINTDYTHTYTYALSSDWNVANLTVVGTVYKIVAEGYKKGINSAKSETIDTRVKDVVVKNSIQAFPIPCTTGITVNLPEMSHNTKITVYSVEGKLVLSQQYYTGSDNLLYIDLNKSNIVPGFYTLMVQTDNNVYSKKIIKY